MLRMPAMLALCFMFGLSVTATVLPAQNAPELAIESVPAEPGDLPALQARDTTGLRFRVYYDAGSQRLARRSLQELAAMYRHLAQLAAVDPSRVQWAAVVFTTNAQYQSPRSSNEVRWSVQVSPAGKLGAQGEADLYGTIAHEQVHAIQKRYPRELPRWFAEGQATWAGLKATASFRPALAQKQRAGHATALQTAGGPLQLRQWGAVTVKREAILRQLTPEQRERLNTDPNYQPPGPFTFTPTDFESDERNTPARYARALVLFEELEGAHGLGIVREWFTFIQELPDTATTERISELAQQVFGIDIGHHLD